MNLIKPRRALCRLALAVLLLAAGASGADTLPVYGYKVLEQLPQNRANFVQGLQILDGQLYVSTGNYGQSHLLRYRLSDGALIDGRKIDPRVFAEGLTVLGERIYQLTWRARRVLVYNKSDLEFIGHFGIPGEGWGLTHNGAELIYSDGSHRLHYISPKDYSITRTIEVSELGEPAIRLNELEWIDGKVWANIWQQDRLVIIDPGSAQVEASVNLTGLLPKAERRPDTAVLNGIAQNPADGAIWVTGKRWPWIYRIELVPEPTADQESEAEPADSR